MRCSKCGSENVGDPKFCSKCGAKFVAIPPSVSVPGGDADLYFCHRHKQEPTRVTCGRCGRPLCPKCMVMGSAGVRCRQCAKARIRMRPRGLVHDAAGGFSNIAKSRVWYVVLWVLVLNLVSGLFGGRRHF